jgi:hypothetical protein
VSEGGRDLREQDDETYYDRNVSSHPPTRKTRDCEARNQQKEKAFHNLRVQTKAKKTTKKHISQLFPSDSSAKYDQGNKHEKKASINSFHPSCMHQFNPSLPQKIHILPLASSSFVVCALRCSRGPIPPLLPHVARLLLQPFEINRLTNSFTSFTSPPTSQPKLTSRSSQLRFQSPLRLQSGSTRRPPHLCTQSQARHRHPLPRHCL